jgi:hypothetical protein
LHFQPDLSYPFSKHLPSNFSLSSFIKHVEEKISYLDGISDDVNGLIILSIKIDNFKKIEKVLWEEIMKTEKESLIEI